jgi:hypothetical protein
VRSVALIVVIATCLQEDDLTGHDHFLFSNRLPNSLQSLFAVVDEAAAQDLTKPARSQSRSSLRRSA